jgi:F-type H+-transporting ATPase subunit c
MPGLLLKLYICSKSCFTCSFMFLLGAKFIGGGLATISMGGAGVGIGVVFAGYLNAVARNPNLERTLFGYAILGFALTEAIALFGLMMAMLIIYS